MVSCCVVYGSEKHVNISSVTVWLNPPQDAGAISQMPSGHRHKFADISSPQRKTALSRDLLCISENFSFQSLDMKCFIPQTDSLGVTDLNFWTVNCKKHGYSPSFWDLLRNMVLARGWSDGLCAILSSVNTHKSVQYVHNDRKHMSAVHFKCSSNESTPTANVLSVRGQKCAVCTGSSPQQMATFRLQSADRAASISRSVGRFITLKPPKHVLLSLIHDQTLAHDNPISLGLGFDANTRLANVTMTTRLLNILHFHYSFNVCICRICHKHEEKGEFLSFTFPSLPLFSLIVLSRAFKGECRKITPSYLLMIIEGKQKERAGVALQLSPGPTTTWTQTCEWTAARRHPVCPIALCVFPSAGPHVYLLFLCTHKHIQAWFVLPSKEKS